MIETYFFCNVHRPCPNNVFHSLFSQGLIWFALLLALVSLEYGFCFSVILAFNYGFEGRYDLVRLVKTI